MVISSLLQRCQWMWQPMTRPYGDGSIFWDKKRQRWIGIYTAGRGAEGQRVRRRVSGRTKTEARQRLRELQREASHGRPAPNGNLRLGPFLDRWLEESVATRGGSPNTVDNYRWAVDRHIKPNLGTRRLRDLSPDDVDSLLRLKAQAGLAHSSLMRIRAVLVQSLRFGERYGYVGRNVAQLVDLPSAPAHQGRSLTVEQAECLLAAAVGERLEGAIVTGLMLGLRPGELLGLTWSAVDFDEDRLSVLTALKRERGVLIIGKPKTPKSIRTLDMPEPVSVALKSQRSRQAKDRLAAGRMWIDHDLAFASEVGTPVDPSNFRRTFGRIAKNAGLGHWHPHELRHSAASLLSASGVPLESVADILGHANPRTTFAIYRHQVSQSIDAAVTPMADMFGTAP
jgi:integrase